MSNPFERDWSKQEEQKPKPYADVVIVFDRSSSMFCLQQGVVDGFNDYVKEMRKNAGDNRWTAYQFDDHNSARGAGESFPQVMFEQCSENKIPYLKSKYRNFGHGCVSGGFIPSESKLNPILEDGESVLFDPRGDTALVDALCIVIDKTELRTSGMDHVKVIMGIFTDGQENSSREFTSPQLRERIARTQTKKGWDYLYFGANQDAFTEASKVGIGGIPTSGHLVAGASYSNNYKSTPEGMSQAISSGMVGMFTIASGAMFSGRILIYES